MKIAPPFFSSRAVLGLTAAGATLLSTGSASAQTTTPFYAFVVSNLTESSGSLAYPVYDSVTFSSTQINEVFADGFTNSFAIGDAMNSVQQMDTQASSLLTSAPGLGYSDPTHGALTSATLTGTLTFPGFFPTSTLPMDVLIDAAGDQTVQNVFTPFSASLFGAAPTGVPVGTFSLQNLGSSLGTTTVNIDATVVPAAVPEASTTVSLGLLLALGLGSLVIARRRTAAATN